MKTYLFVLSLLASFTVSAQYYYKDVVGTKETADIIQAYKKANVRRVVLNSYDATNTKNDAFYVEQVFSPQFLKTITRSGDEDPSLLISYYNEAGQVIKTIDSSNALISTTTYSYLPSGSLTTVISHSSDSSGRFTQTEEHQWEHNNTSARMLRIKNTTDTTFVTFKLDERGNITEEQSIRRGIKADPVYYYYDAQNRLTDIVRFNQKARRLLPEYMFEYSAANQVIQKITVPSNNSEYLIWRYQYDANGLKIKEAIYTKQKQLTGKIEYVYQRG